MANLTVTPTRVGVAYESARIRNVIGGAAIQGGASVYIDSAGKAQLTNSGAAGTSQFAGIALPRMQSGYACGVGTACEVIHEGEVEGFDLSGMAYWDPVYLSDTAGALGTTAGTKSQIVGRVIPTSEPDGSGNPRKLLYVHAPINTIVT